MPTVPPAPDYSARAVAQKLGIKPGQQVAVIGGPPGAADLLGPLPDGARLTARPTADTALLVWFVRAAGDLQQGVARVAADAGDRVVWMIWRKQGAPSGTAAGVNGNSIREAGLAAGLVTSRSARSTRRGRRWPSSAGAPRGRGRADRRPGTPEGD